MKKLSILFLVLLSTTWMSCEKVSFGDSFGEGTVLAPYVALSSTSAKTVKQGASTTFTFNMKSALQQIVTVTYNITGAYTATGTATIDRNKTSGTATVTVPAATIVAPATSAKATFTVSKATTADGATLTLGANNVATGQVVTINITP